MIWKKWSKHQRAREIFPKGRIIGKYDRCLLYRQKIKTVITYHQKPFNIVQLHLFVHNMSRGQLTTPVAKRKPLSLKLSRGGAAKSVDLKDTKTCASRTASVEDKENFNTINSQKIKETAKRVIISSPTKRAVFRAKVEAVVAAHQASKEVDEIIQINDIQLNDEQPIIENQIDSLKEECIIVSSSPENLPIIESNGSPRAHTLLSIMLVLVFVAWSAARIAMLEPFRNIIMTYYKSSVDISSPQYVSVAAYLKEHKAPEQQEFIYAGEQEPVDIIDLDFSTPAIEDSEISTEETYMELTVEPVMELEDVDSAVQNAATEAVVALPSPTRSGIRGHMQIAGNRLRSMMKPIVEVLQRLQTVTKNWFHQAVRLFSGRSDSTAAASS